MRKNKHLNFLEIKMEICFYHCLTWNYFAGSEEFGSAHFASWV